MRIAAALAAPKPMRPGEMHTLAALWMREAVSRDCDLLLLPGLYGWVWDSDVPFLDQMRTLSRQNHLLLCPGSYPEETDEGTYHSTCLMYRGAQILTQRQLYLYPWEAAQNIARGDEIGLAQFRGVSIGLLAPADAYYPSVARALAMEGAVLLLSPTALPAEQTQALHETLWGASQVNRVFVLSSAFAGSFADCEWMSETSLIAPFPLTKTRDGFAVRARADSALMIADVEFARLYEGNHLGFQPVTLPPVSVCASAFDAGKGA